MAGNLMTEWILWIDRGTAARNCRRMIRLQGLGPLSFLSVKASADSSEIRGRRSLDAARLRSLRLS